MATWTLTITEAHSTHTQHGTAATRADAATEILRAARETVHGIDSSARYTFDMDGGTAAILQTYPDEHGQPNPAATLELLDRIEGTL